MFIEIFKTIVMKITYVALPEEQERILPFYLAMEEHVARNLPAQDYFFMWQVQPTVIFGRNQLIENEVNLDYCRSHHIQTYRRKSGGGCVYADKSNIMFSYITPDSNVNFTFNRYMLMVEEVLRRLGVNAKTTGRNDILIEGKKVSGNAFYHLPTRSIVHGTMLFDTDMENLVRSTTPSVEKLVSKGVQSVRQHVTTLNQYLTIDIETFKSFVRTHLCCDSITLGEEDIKKIEAIEEEYLQPSFIYGSNPACSVVKKLRIEGVGEFEARIELKGGLIKNINLMGDYFLVGDIGSLLESLKEVPYNRAAVEAVLGDTAMESIIHHLSREQFINIIFYGEQENLSV